MQYCREKKREYSARVREIEHGSFTPLVFSSTGGLGHEAKVFYKRLASLLSIKWDRSYSNTLTWIRCCLSFSLLRSSIRCIRGYRSKCGNPVRVRLSPPLDVIQCKLNLDYNLLFVVYTFVNCITYFFKLLHWPPGNLQVNKKKRKKYCPWNNVGVTAIKTYVGGQM